MITLATFTWVDTTITQAVLKDDPTDIRQACEELVADHKLEAYSLIALKDHAMGSDF
jgi:hypothetical protein